MKGFTTIAALAAVVSTSYAARVVLKETPCLQESELEEYTIETDKLFVQEMPSVCGLQIISAEGADVNAITCQAFKDAEGKEPGSAKFTFKTSASIATNPVQENSIRCDVDQKVDNNLLSALESAATTATTVVVSSGTQLPTSGGNSTVPSATQTPSPTGTGEPEPTGAAATFGWSVGALAVAFAGLML